MDNSSTSSSSSDLTDQESDEGVQDIQAVVPIERNMPMPMFYHQPNRQDVIKKACIQSQTQAESDFVPDLHFLFERIGRVGFMEIGGYKW